MAEISGRAVGAGAACALLGEALAFATSSEAAAPYDDSVRCRDRVVRKVDVQTRTAEATVFTKLKRYGGEALPTTYGCMRNSPRLTRLDRPTVDRATHPILAGHFVAFTRVEHLDRDTESVGVYNLRIGAEWHRLATQPDGGEPPATVQAMVLKRNSSIVWLTAAATGEQELWMLESGPEGVPITEIDDGPPFIEPDSLRLSRDNRTVSWVKATRARSVPID